MSQPRSNPGYVDPAYLQAAVELVGPIKQQSYALMQLTAGQTVLDVGCGPGTDTIPLARLVGPEGCVVGVDYDLEMIAAANQKADQLGIAGWVRHQQADGSRMPFETHTFDAVRSERVFQHVAHPEQIMAEMVRVTKPGGWIVLGDTDSGSMSTDITDPELIDLEWRLRRSRAEMLINGYSGRQLYRLCKHHHLTDVQVTVCPLIVTDYTLSRYLGLAETAESHALSAGTVTSGELERYHRYLEQTDRDGEFFCYAVMLLAVGRRP